MNNLNPIYLTELKTLPSLSKSKQKKLAQRIFDKSQKFWEKGMGKAAERNYKMGARAYYAGHKITPPESMVNPKLLETIK